MPRQRFVHPEDALEQLTRAVRAVTSGCSAPAGRALAVGRLGVGRDGAAGRRGRLPVDGDRRADPGADARASTFARDGRGQRRSAGAAVHAVPGRRPAARRSRARFRDHALSDLIGFTYAGWPADAAADDFVAPPGRSRAAAIAARPAGKRRPISVILDGENAWEHFEGGGRPFLRALYGRLSDHPELRTVTMAEACAGRGTDAAGIFPGLVDRRQLLHLDRPSRTTTAPGASWPRRGDALDEASGGVEPRRSARAREELLIAEGSDWFWWYGDDHSSDHDLEFDDLFRRHLRNVYRLLARPIPDELFVSNISTGAAAGGRDRRRPALLHADARRRGDQLLRVAGRRHARGPRGRRGDAPDRPRRAVLTQVQFGFDRERLFVRSTPRGRCRSCWPTGYEFALKFLQPDGRPVLGPAGARPAGRELFWTGAPAEPTWVERGAGGARWPPGRPRGWRCRWPTLGWRPARRWRSSWRSTTPGASSSSGIRRTGRSS